MKDIIVFSAVETFRYLSVLIPDEVIANFLNVINGKARFYKNNLERNAIFHRTAFIEIAIEEIQYLTFR